MAPVFHPFDPHKEFQATHRHLPHWQQPGATYFVTFRLADSLPVEARDRFIEMRQLNQSETFAWLDRYLDASNGTCLLRDTGNAGIVAGTLRHFDGQHYHVGAFVVMPNHVHALVQPITPHTLTTVLRSWKSYTAHELQRHTACKGSVWQEESFDRIVRDEAELRKFTDYIFANPAKARLAADSYIVGQGSADWLAPKG